MKPEDKIYWFKFFLGIIIGLISTIFKLHQPTALIAVIFAIMIYIIFSITSPMLLKISKAEVDMKKRFIVGLGTYFLVWIVSWILSYNIYYYYLS